MTERLDRIEGAIEQINSALNVLITEFIRPNAQQARDNYERLERVESALDRAAAQTVVNAEQSGTNEQLIAGNAAAIAETRTLVQANTAAIAETRELVQANAEAIITNEQRFEVMRGDANADRQRWQAAADADRAENRRRFDAQMEITQAMLLQLSNLNRRVEDLEHAS